MVAQMQEQIKQQSVTSLQSLVSTQQWSNVWGEENSPSMTTSPSNSGNWIKGSILCIVVEWLLILVWNMHESYFTIGYLISGLKTYHANYCAFIPPEKGIKIHLTLLNPSQLYNGQKWNQSLSDRVTLLYLITHLGMIPDSDTIWQRLRFKCIFLCKISVH